MVGLKVNFHKSHIICIGGYNTRMMVIESLMGCVRNKFPFTYLGIPLRKAILKRGEWKEIVERLHKRYIVGKEKFF